MLWLALRFPSLPLEIFTRGSSASSPVAIVGSTEANADIVSCNAAARRIGVQPGMAVTAAWAIAPRLQTITRNRTAEREALERMAAWALQFTPAVSVATADELVMEVGGSLQLFGGFNQLWTEIERRIPDMGYTVLMAAAPTPVAAQWFARAGLSPRIRHNDALRLSLEKLPLAVAQLPAALADLFGNIGASTLGECLRLPRDGLARRGGKPFLELLDRALGKISDPRPFFSPPVIFKAGIALPAPVERTDALLFAARRLVAELCGMLTATGKGVQRLRFLLSHERHQDTQFSLDLASSTRDPDHLISVLRERLQRTALPCPATALAIESELLLPLASRNLTFLPDEQSDVETVVRLLERLRARLGKEAVRGFDIVADHRPERAWRSCEPGEASGACGRSWQPSARPLWLLPSPRLLPEIGEVPQHGGPLTMLTLPERIESGWWDGHDVEREYYVARNPAQSLLWIYRDRSKSGWYLHGFFS
jgi:protein ImuB